MELRDYQLVGMRDIFNGWTTHDILMFILATGGGKTVTFVDVIKQFLAMNKNTLLIAHRQELITQAWETLYQNRVYAGVIKAGYPKAYDLRAQVGSVQTLTRRDLDKIPKPDLIVIDEAHHVTKDNGYGKILSHFPDAKVLLVTATPYRLSGEGFTEVVKGKETKLIINQTLKQLQEKAFLVPIDYYIASIPDLTHIKLKGGDYAEEEAERAMQLAPLVESYKEHCSGMCGVVFAVNVHHSKSIAAQYRAAGISAEHFDATTDDITRADLLSRFRRREILILTNVGIVSEGFDMPNIEFVQLAAPTKSLSAFLQKVGRATRALAGLVDGPHARTITQRRENLANSLKPRAIVLDNAGAFMDCGFPDDDIDWEMHFKGRKSRTKAKVEEEIEILIYVAEDGDGKTIRTTNPKEIEGLRLVKVDKQVREQIINVKALKEFDKQYAMVMHLPYVKQKGIFAIKNYLDYCRKNNFAVTPEAWAYIETKLVTNIYDEIARLEANKRALHGAQYLMTDAFNDLCKRIRVKGLSKTQFKAYKEDYDNSQSKHKK